MPYVKKYLLICTTEARAGENYLKKATIMNLVKLCPAGGNIGVNVGSTVFTLPTFETQYMGLIDDFFWSFFEIFQ